jgi:WD40 repeat protein
MDSEIRIWDTATGSCFINRFYVPYIPFPMLCIFFPHREESWKGYEGAQKMDHWVGLEALRMVTIEHWLSLSWLMGAWMNLNFFVSSADASSVGRRLASSSKDGTIKVWDVDRKICVHTLSGHTNAVKAMR